MYINKILSLDRKEIRYVWKRFGIESMNRKYRREAQKVLKKNSKSKRIPVSSDYKHVDHIDNDWILNKIGSHGGSHSYSSPSGLARIGYIGSTGKLKIWYYNLILLFKYIKRKLNK
jgi:hypothetical protein